MKKQSLAYFLLFTLFVQSCTIYQKTSVSLQDASQKNEFLKLKTTRGDKIIFDRIILVDSVYYGIKGNKKTELTPNQIEGIYLKDYTKTSRATILGLTLGLGLPVLVLSIYVIIAIIEWSDD